MTSEEIIARLTQRFGAEKVQRIQPEGWPQPHALIPKEILREAATYLRDDPELDCRFLVTIAASDWLPEEKKIKDEGGERSEEVPGRMEVAYVFASYSKNHRVNVKLVVDRAGPVVPSLYTLFPAADWHEREQYDLFGIDFQGHKDLRRILLPEDWEGWPLRKDYQEAPEWRGITTTRVSSHEAFKARLALEEAAEREESGS